MYYRFFAMLLALFALTACGPEVGRSLEDANKDANDSYLEKRADDEDSDIEIDEEGNAVWSDLEGEELESALKLACGYYREAKVALDAGDRDTAYDWLIYARKNSEGTPAEEQIRDMFDNFNNRHGFNGDGRTYLQELIDEFDAQGSCDGYGNTGEEIEAVNGLPPCAPYLKAMEELDKGNRKSAARFLDEAFEKAHGTPMYYELQEMSDTIRDDPPGWRWYNNMDQRMEGSPKNWEPRLSLDSKISDFGYCS